MLDTIRTIETPEGVELKLTCASFYARSVAWFIDLLIQLFIMTIFLFILPKLGDFGMGLLFIFLFFLHWLYPVFFEMLMQGQTPGKKMMKLQVLLIDGTLLNWGASLLRNLLRTVDFLPFMYALGVISMILSKDFRRLGDLAANTMVVYTRQLKEKVSIAHAQSIAPEIVLTAAEQQTLVNYAERFNDFSPERAEELARLATPLLQQLPDINQQTAASQRLLSIASYLMGHR